MLPRPASQGARHVPGLLRAAARSMGPDPALVTPARQTHPERVAAVLIPAPCSARCCGSGSGGSALALGGGTRRAGAGPNRRLLPDPFLSPPAQSPTKGSAAPSLFLMVVGPDGGGVGALD